MKGCTPDRWSMWSVTRVATVRVVWLRGCHWIRCRSIARAAPSWSAAVRNVSATFGSSNASKDWQPSRRKNTRYAVLPSVRIEAIAHLDRLVVKEVLKAG